MRGNRGLTPPHHHPQPSAEAPGGALQRGRGCAGARHSRRLPWQRDESRSREPGLARAAAVMCCRGRRHEATAPTRNKAQRSEWGSWDGTGSTWKTPALGIQHKQLLWGSSEALGHPRGALLHREGSQIQEIKGVSPPEARGGRGAQPQARSAPAFRGCGVGWKLNATPPSRL